MSIKAPDDLSPIYQQLFTTVAERLEELHGCEFHDRQVITNLCRSAERATRLNRAAEQAMAQESWELAMKLSNAAERAAGAYRSALDGLKLSVSERSSKASQKRRAETAGDGGGIWAGLLQ